MRGELSPSALRRAPTCGRSGTATGSPAPGTLSRLSRWRTTSPSTPPRRSMPRPASPATQAPSPDQPAALLRPLQTDDAHRLAPGQPASRERSPHAPLCSCPRLGRALPDQIAPLLRHLRHTPPSPPRAPQTPAPPRRRTRPWGRPLDDTVVLIIKTWSYCDPAQPPRRTRPRPRPRSTRPRARAGRVPGLVGTYAEEGCAWHDHIAGPPARRQAHHR